MRIWLLKDGETSPLLESGRPMRMGVLASTLAARGHTVVWWSSTFPIRENSCSVDVIRE